MDYLYSRVENAEFDCDTPERAAFHDLLILVANALHDIEWVDSGDKGPGEEDEAILTALGGVKMTRVHQVKALKESKYVLEGKLRDSCYDEAWKAGLREELAAVEKQLAEMLASDD